MRSTMWEAGASTPPIDAAVIDVGSNSVRLVLYRVEGRAVWTVFNEKILAGLGRGEDVDPSEYVFRTSTQIETAAADLDWLNKGVFIGVGGRQPGGVIYETYLVE